MDTASDSLSGPASLPHAGATPAADLAYETFYGAAIGGSVIALFFLVVDMLNGQALFTPSLIGTALFTGADPATITDIRLDMVAAMSAIHFAAFLGLSGAISALCRKTGLSARNPLLVTVVIFVVLSVVFLLAEMVVMPGVGRAIGFGWVFAANALTAAAMAAFLRREHAQG